MKPQVSLTPRASLELAVLGTLWGGTFLSIRLALDEMSVLSTILHRVLWAALLLWCIVKWRGLSVPRKPLIWCMFFVMGALNNVIPYGLMTWGQLHIETGLTSILNSATALFGVITAALFFVDERLTLRKICGVGLGFCGVILTVGADALRSFDLRSLAQLAVLAGAMSYALAGVWARKMLSEFHPLVNAAGMLTGSTVILAVAAIWQSGGIDLPQTLTGFGAIAYYALGATALAYPLYYRILAMAGSGNLMLVTLIVPPIAIALGALVLGEALGPTAFIGFGLLVTGLLVLDGRVIPKRFR